MALILTTTAEVAQKTGAGVNAAYDGTMQENAELRGIAMIGIYSRHFWHDNLPTNIGIKNFLADIVSSYIAIEGITYDMSGYTSRVEAEDMINVLRDGMLRNLALLQEQENEDFIKDNAT